MATRFWRSQNSFLMGQVNTGYKRRTDIESVQQAATKMENFVPLSGGSVRVRPVLDIVTSTWRDFTNPRIIEVVDGTNHTAFVADTNGSKVMSVYDADLTAGTIGVAAIYTKTLPAQPDKQMRYAQFGPKIFLLPCEGQDPLVLDVDNSTGAVADFYIDLPFTVGFSGGAEVKMDTSYIEAVGGATNGSYDPIDDFTSYFSLGNKVRIAGTEYTVSGSVAPTATILTLNGSHGMPQSTGLRCAEPLSIGSANRPKDVEVWGGRLCFVGPGTKFRASASYDPYVIEPSLKLKQNDSDPIEVDVLSASDDKLYWIKAAQTLIIGGGKHELALTNRDPISGTNFPSFSVISNYGSDNDTWVGNLGNTLAMVPKGTDKTAVFEFNFQTQKYNPVDKTVFFREDSPTSVSTTDSIAYVSNTDVDGLPRGIVCHEDGSIELYAEVAGVPFWSMASTTLPSGVTVEEVFSIDDTLYLFCKRSSDGKYAFFKLNGTKTFALDYQVTGTVNKTAGGDFYKSKDAFVIGVKGATNASLGTLSLDSNGVFTLPSGHTGYDSYIVGTPFVATLDLGIISGGDSQGGLSGRKHRLVRAVVEYADARQFYINSQAMIPQLQGTLGKIPNARDGEATRRILGWKKNHTLSIESSPPYNVKILSVAEEVAV